MTKCSIADAAPIGADSAPIGADQRWPAPISAESAPIGGTADQRWSAPIGADNFFLIFYRRWSAPISADDRWSAPTRRWSAKSAPIDRRSALIGADRRRVGGHVIGADRRRSAPIKILCLFSGRRRSAPIGADQYFSYLIIFAIAYYSILLFWKLLTFFHHHERIWQDILGKSVILDSKQKSSKANGMEISAKPGQSAQEPTRPSCKSVGAIWAVKVDLTAKKRNNAR